MFEFLLIISVLNWLRRVGCGSVWDPLTRSYFFVTCCCRHPRISLQAPKQPVTNLSELNKIQLPIPKSCVFSLFDSSLFAICSEYVLAVFHREFKFECMRSIRAEIAHWPLFRSGAFSDRVCLTLRHLVAFLYTRKHPRIVAGVHVWCHEIEELCQL